MSLSLEKENPNFYDSWTDGLRRTPNRTRNSQSTNKEETTRFSERHLTATENPSFNATHVRQESNRDQNNYQREYFTPQTPTITPVRVEVNEQYTLPPVYNYQAQSTRSEDHRPLVIKQTPSRTPKYEVTSFSASFGVEDHNNRVTNILPSQIGMITPNRQLAYPNQVEYVKNNDITVKKFNTNQQEKATPVKNLPTVTLTPRTSYQTQTPNYTYQQDNSIKTKSKNVMYDSYQEQQETIESANQVEIRKGEKVVISPIRFNVDYTKNDAQEYFMSETPTPQIRTRQGSASSKRLVSTEVTGYVEPRVIKRLSVKELQQEIGIRHLEPIKSQYVKTEPKEEPKKEIVYITQPITKPPAEKIPQPIISRPLDSVTREEYDRLKILYDEVKEENDKKKNYIQELAGKYQGIIEDLKIQLNNSTKDDTTYQENLKLRQVIKKMDEEINTLTSKNQNQNKNKDDDINQLYERIEELKKTNSRLQDENTSFKMGPKHDQILVRERELWETERTIIESRVKEKVTQDYRVKEDILKKQMETLLIEKKSTLGENERLRSEMDRLLLDLKRLRDESGDWMVEKSDLCGEIKVLNIKIKELTSIISSLEIKLENKEKFVNYDKEGEIVFLKMKIKDLELERSNWRDQLARLEAELIFLQGVNVQSHEISHDVFKEKINNLLQEQTQMSNKVLKMESDMIQAQMESRSLHKQNLDLQSANGFIKNNNQTLQDDVVNLVEQIEKLNKRYKKTEKNLNQVSVAYDELAKIHENPKSYIPKGEHLMLKQDQLDQINQLKNDIQAKNEELSTLQKLKNEANEKNDLLKDNLDTGNHQLKKLENDNNKLLEDIKELKNNQELAKNKINKNIEELREEKQKNSKNQQKISDLEDLIKKQTMDNEGNNQSIKDKNTQLHALTREIQQLKNITSEAPQNLINPGNKHSIIKDNHEHWDNFKEKMKDKNIAAYNRTSEDHQNAIGINFLNINEDTFRKGDPAHTGSNENENYFKLHNNLPGDSMPLYVDDDVTPISSNIEKLSPPKKEKVAVSTIKYGLEKAPHRFLDSDVDIQNVSNPGRSSIDTGFGGFQPRVVITENNTAKNTIIPKHQNLNKDKDDNMMKMIKEMDQLKKENEKLKEQNKHTSPVTLQTPRLGEHAQPHFQNQQPYDFNISNEDSKINVLDLKKPGLDSYTDLGYQPPAYPGQYRNNQYPPQPYAQQPQNQNFQNPKNQNKNKTNNVSPVDNYNSPGLISNNYNSPGLPLNDQQSPYSYNNDNYYKPVAPQANNKPHSLPKFAPQAESGDSLNSSLVKLNQSEEYKVNQTLHNYFKDLDNYLINGKSPDTKYNIPPELHATKLRENIASDRVYNPKSTEKPHVPGIDYLAKHKSRNQKKASQDYNPNIYEADTFEVDNDTNKYQTPSNNYQNMTPGQNYLTSDSNAHPANRKIPKQHIFTTETPEHYNKQRKDVNQYPGRVQNFNQTPGIYSNNSELEDLKNKVGNLVSDKNKMSQTIEELKSEINAFKCGLRAMLGDEPESRNYSPNLYDINQSVKLGQSTEESNLGGQNEDYEFLKDRVIQLQSERDNLKEKFDGLKQNLRKNKKNVAENVKNIDKLTNNFKRNLIDVMKDSGVKK